MWTYIFDINQVFFELLGYKVSYLEAIGTLLGLVSVIFATRVHIGTWLCGILNNLFFFYLFYQSQLYPDMFLQVYFAFTSVYGLMYWRGKTQSEEIRMIKGRQVLYLSIGILFFSTGSGILFTLLTQQWPLWFKATPGLLVYADSLIAWSSVVANLLLARRVLENWWFWIAADLLAFLVYLQRGLLLLAVEYVLFLILCVYGLYRWRKLHQAGALIR